LVAVTEHVPVPLVMVIVVPDAEQAPVPLKVTAPVPLPPLLPTVNVAPNACGVPGTPVTVNAAWLARAAADHHGQPLGHLAQGFGLGAQLLAGGSTLLGVGGGFLGDLFHLRDSLGNLLDAAGLFLAAHADLVHEGLDVVCAFGNGTNGDGHFIQARSPSAGSPNCSGLLLR
jgi:hypothetical protein